MAGEQIIEKKTYRHKPVPLILMYLFARIWIPLREQFEKWGKPPYPKAILDAAEQTRELFTETLTIEQYLRWNGWDKKL